MFVWFNGLASTLPTDTINPYVFNSAGYVLQKMAGYIYAAVFAIRKLVKINSTW